MEKKLKLLKTVGDVVVSVGVGAIIANGIKNNTPAKKGLFGGICIAAGSLVLSNMVTDAATKYTDEKFEKVLKYVRKFKEIEPEKKEEKDSFEEKNMNNVIDIKAEVVE